MSRSSTRAYPSTIDARFGSRTLTLVVQNEDDGDGGED